MKRILVTALGLALTASLVVSPTVAGTAFHQTLNDQECEPFQSVQNWRGDVAAGAVYTVQQDVLACNVAGSITHLEASVYSGPAARVTLSASGPSGQSLPVEIIKQSGGNLTAYVCTDSAELGTWTFRVTGVRDSRDVQLVILVGRPYPCT